MQQGREEEKRKSQEGGHWESRWRESNAMRIDERKAGKRTTQGGNTRQAEEVHRSLRPDVLKKQAGQRWWQGNTGARGGTIELRVAAGLYKRAPGMASGNS